MTPPSSARIRRGKQFVLLAALVRMKLAAFRDKDRVRLRDLVSVGLVDASWLPGLSTLLRERLALIPSTPEG